MIAVTYQAALLLHSFQSYRENGVRVLCSRGSGQYRDHASPGDLLEECGAFQTVVAKWFWVSHKMEWQLVQSLEEDGGFQTAVEQ